MGPVIEAGAAHVFVIDGKPQRADQMQMAVHSNTGTRNVAGVLWNFWLYENNMKHRSKGKG